MLKRLALIFLALGMLPLFSAPPAEPLYIVLYSRFYDHSHQTLNVERLQHLFSLLDNIQKNHPEAHVSAVAQFSGTVSQVLLEQNGANHLVDRLKEYAAKGLIEIGYTGEEEPSYLNRPRPKLLLDDTPETRWLAQGEATEHFLTDFKNPVTGEPFPGSSGGLKRMQEVLGPAILVSGITEMVSGDAAVTHQLRKINPGAVLSGLTAPDPRHNIEGYTQSVDDLAKVLSRPSLASPEVFWEDGMLRLSEFSFPDYRPRSTDLKPEELKTFLSKMNRTRPRVMRLEVTSYTRYLFKRSDGSVRWDPMEWLYYHPQDPTMPTMMKAFVDPGRVRDGYRNEEAVLESVITDFFASNPGSRFLSLRELKAMAQDPAGKRVSQDELRSIATGVSEHYKESPLDPPAYLTAGPRSFSTAEAFALLARGLTTAAGRMPEAVELKHVYGPLVTDGVFGDVAGLVTVADIMKAASQISPVISNDEWKPVPDNRVPPLVSVGALKVNSTQFLNLMARAYLDPVPDRKISLSPMHMNSRLTLAIPKNTMARDQGNTWTLKPAPLRTDAPGGATVAVK